MNDVILCNSIKELEFYVEKSIEIINERHLALLKTPLCTDLFTINKIDAKDEEDDQTVLIYDYNCVVFTSEKAAEDFMDSFMDISMKSGCKINKVIDFMNFFKSLDQFILADGLIIKRIEFEEEKENGHSVWHCEDIIYDPNKSYSK